ncbi:ABC transporter ATP-binding protein [Vagococcus zengguangii]|uniref:ABC transporter ATP-binding protein n=1 Tax=Vagococcus zengguangii TaxID=2571750 RepID=UPI0011084A86|nr:ABC transporter ATP-binding protein [Vagococcus zengguangii]TLG78353.1 ABC transporter ATP-binding protein [Vagococcus zengguangii]
MWKYIKPYLLFAILAVCFMITEVSMDLLQPSLMSQIIDEGVMGSHNQGNPDLDLVVKLGLIMISIIVIGAIGGFLNNIFVQNISQRIGNKMRQDSFKRIMSFSFPQIDQFGTGSLVTRMTNDITQVQAYISMFIRTMVRTGMMMFGSIFFMFRLDPKFGWIVLCAFPFVIGCIALCLWKANPLFDKLQRQLDDINNIMQEDIAGIRMIKACVREVYEKIRFGKANDALIKTQLKTLMIFAFMNPIMNMLMYSVIGLLIHFGSKDIAAGVSSPGTIMAAITYTTQLLNAILSLVMLFQIVSKGLASWHRLRVILETEPELVDGAFNGQTLTNGAITFEDVAFSFPDSQQPVLKQINLTINPGETIGLMGATGCGKSSLVNLISRFYDVTSGRVLVDGVDVRDYQQQALRQKIAVVLQKTDLFNVTIADNIRWGNPQASDEEVVDTAKIAQAHAFISETENGYQNMVTERGSNLSGGQKQRLSIARAVIKPADIIIFDDATSALDLSTESNLYQALNQQRP